MDEWEKSPQEEPLRLTCFHTKRTRYMTKRLGKRLSELICSTELSRNEREKARGTKSLNGRI